MTKEWKITHLSQWVEEKWGRGASLKFGPWRASFMNRKWGNAVASDLISCNTPCPLPFCRTLVTFRMWPHLTAESVSHQWFVLHRHQKKRHVIIQDVCSDLRPVQFNWLIALHSNRPLFPDCIIPINTMPFFLVSNSLLTVCFAFVISLSCSHCCVCIRSVCVCASQAGGCWHTKAKYKPTIPSSSLYHRPQDVSYPSPLSPNTRRPTDKSSLS